jgi:peptidoglycan hydrolase-like protein with peptidoglycan-binding domain
MKRLAIGALAVTALGVGIAPSGSATAAPTSTPAAARVAAVTVPAAPSALPRLALGAKGDAVKTLQKALTDKGYQPGPLDGKFGPRTRAAVLAFQRANKLTVDGWVGPQTWGRLNAATPATPATPATAGTAPATPATPATPAGAATTKPGAPPVATWDKLAWCESGQRWNLNLGTGYYGGLQFTLQAWKGAGGTGLPSDASKQEQINRATVLWERYGWKPWPTCSRKLGLA